MRAMAYDTYATSKTQHRSPDRAIVANNLQLLSDSPYITSYNCRTIGGVRLATPAHRVCVRSALILDRPVDDVDRALDADDKVDVGFDLFPLKIPGERLDQRSPLLDQSPTGLPKDGDIALFQVSSPYEL